MTEPGVQSAHLLGDVSELEAELDVVQLHGVLGRHVARLPEVLEEIIVLRNDYLILKLLPLLT